MSSEKRTYEKFIMSLVDAKVHDWLICLLFVAAWKRYPDQVNLVCRPGSPPPSATRNLTNHKAKATGRAWPVISLGESFVAYRKRANSSVNIGCMHVCMHVCMHDAKGKKGVGCVGETRECGMEWVYWDVGFVFQEWCVSDWYVVWFVVTGWRMWIRKVRRVPVERISALYSTLGFFFLY